MSIKVENLTMTYGAQNAIDNISFEAHKGEILGFLGPNGAGKTTTMKILTCFMPATSGRAFVSGFDVESSPLDIKKRIGYLPEHNPLYDSMYVREYLEFVAKIHKIKNPKQRIDEMIELTGLQTEQHKLISALSKGYRQRIGLAQAIIHDPEVLILDEPTSGLDPNQLVEIRQLIRDIGKDKTVLFSSHIMQEVQHLCDRVIILKRGRIVADDNINILRDKVKGSNVVFLELAEKVDMNKLNSVSGVTEVRKIDDYKCEVISGRDVDVRKDLFSYAVSESWHIIGMNKEEVSIENVFQKLTN